LQFVQIGFYGPIKDQDTMFQAFAIIAEKIACHLTLLGERFDSAQAQQMLVDLKIKDKVTVAGYVKNNELKMYLDKSHILLHTALFESGCAVIQEAMASGVVVCGTQVGLLHDIGSQYALIVPPQNPKALGLSVIKLVNDPDLYESISTEAHKWIMQNDAAWSYEKYLNFFNEVIHKKRLMLLKN
jgi:glycosyltransferase involved in cell wall biosynthesis